MASLFQIILEFLESTWHVLFKLIFAFLLFGQLILVWKLGPIVGVSKESLNDFGLFLLFLTAGITAAECTLVSTVLGWREPWGYKKGLASVPALLTIWAVFTLGSLAWGAATRSARFEEERAQQDDAEQKAEMRKMREGIDNIRPEFWKGMEDAANARKNKLSLQMNLAVELA